MLQCALLKPLICKLYSHIGKGDFTSVIPSIPDSSLYEQCNPEFAEYLPITEELLSDKGKNYMLYIQCTALTTRGLYRISRNRTTVIEIAHVF